MAATIAKAYGYDTGRVKEAHRVGSEFSQAQANTFRTFTTAQIAKDGSGFIEVRRDGVLLHAFSFGPEAKGEQNG